MNAFTALRGLAFRLMTALMSALVLTAAAHAQQPPAGTWADPTRPAAAQAADTGASVPRAARAAGAASAPAPALLQLQSVQVGASGQTSALVDGRTVQLGDALGASRIVAIDADGLTLRDAKGRTERLLLIPSAIAKRDGSPERPLAALSTGTHPRAGREGQRP
jgi:MSHA biogenesis protein MshK